MGFSFLKQYQNARSALEDGSRFLEFFKQKSGNYVNVLKQECHRMRCLLCQRLSQNRAKHTKNQQKFISPLMPTPDTSAFVSLLLLAGKTKKDNWHFTFTIFAAISTIVKLLLNVSGLQ